jgi:hypothetical protein
MDAILDGLTPEQLKQVAQCATQRATQASGPVEEEHRQDHNEGSSVETDNDGEIGERKRKRDPNSPKEKRLHPSLRDVSLDFSLFHCRETNGSNFRFYQSPVPNQEPDERPHPFPSGDGHSPSLLGSTRTPAPAKR